VLGDEVRHRLRSIAAREAFRQAELDYEREHPAALQH
jgi:hypothetical protein